MATEIPALKVSKDSLVVSSSGSWFHILMLDRKKTKENEFEFRIATLATVRN